MSSNLPAPKPSHSWPAILTVTTLTGACPISHSSILEFISIGLLPFYLAALIHSSCRTCACRFILTISLLTAGVIFKLLLSSAVDGQNWFALTARAFHSIPGGYYAQPYFLNILFPVAVGLAALLLFSFLPKDP